MKLLPQFTMREQHLRMRQPDRRQERKGGRKEGRKTQGQDRSEQFTMQEQHRKTKDNGRKRREQTEISRFFALCAVCLNSKQTVCEK